MEAIYAWVLIINLAGGHAAFDYLSKVECEQHATDLATGGWITIDGIGTTEVVSARCERIRREIG